MSILGTLRQLACIAPFILKPTMIGAQSTADSVAVVRSLGAALRGEAREVLGTFVCIEDGRPCHAPPKDSSIHLLVRKFAQVSGAKIVPERRIIFPPCPWGYDPPKAKAGYVVRLARPRWSERGDSAYVMVFNRCDNPPGYVHDIFGRDDEYVFIRTRSGQWPVVTKRMTRITQRMPALSGGRAPGA